MIEAPRSFALEKGGDTIAGLMRKFLRKHVSSDGSPTSPS